MQPNFVIGATFVLNIKVMITHFEVVAIKVIAVIRVAILQIGDCYTIFAHFLLKVVDCIIE